MVVAHQRRLALPLAGGLGLAACVALFSRLGVLGLGLVGTVLAVAITVPLAALAADRLAPARPAGWLPQALAIPSAALYAVCFLAPLALLVVFAFATPLIAGRVEYGLSFDNLSAALGGLYVDTLLRTLRVAAIGTALVIGCGLPLAYWLARHAPARRRGLLVALVVVPFWTSFLIRTYSFLIVLSPSFPLSRVLNSLGVIGGPLDVLNTAGAVQIGLVYNYLPLFVLPAYAALEHVDWRTVEAAQDVGATPFRAFLQVTLPQARSGLAAAAMLAFIPMCGEYVIPLILGGGRIDMVGNVIARSFLDQQDYPFGAALSLIVMAGLSVAMIAYLRAALREDARVVG